MPGPGGMLGFLDQEEQQPQANPLLSDIGAQAPAYLGGGAGGAQGMFGGGGSVPQGLAQYFDQFGQARIQDPRQVAADSGISLGQLAGSFNPRQTQGGNVDFNLPSNGGGFFSIQDIFGLSGTPALAPNVGPGMASGNNQHVYRQGQVDVPSINTFEANLPSTNNWRLLGYGPGYIMRNGQIIDMNQARTSRGFPAGGTANMGNSGEQSIPGGVGISFGTGGSYGVPNLYANGGFPAFAGWPGAINGWRNVFPGNS